MPARTAAAAAVLATAAILLSPVPALAQTSPLVTVVAAGDAALEQTLVGIGATVAYFDANANGRVDRDLPDEPVYFDTNHDSEVGYGDVRLTGFSWYPAGTYVGLSNDDGGLRLTPILGWFASTANGAWFIDTDASRSVSEGDLRLGAAGAAKVGATDPERGTTLQTAQTSAPASNRIAVRDASGDSAFQPGEVLYLDVDSNQGVGSLKVSAGDLRFSPGAAPVDRQPLAPAPGTTQSTVTVGTDGTTTYVQQASSTGWRTLDWILVALAVANLAAFVFIVRTVRPRNPFK